jgi:rare lipoprotein A
MQLRPQHRQCLSTIVCVLSLAGCSSLPNGGAPSASSDSSRLASKSAYPALPAAGSGRGGYYLDDGPGDNIPDGLENLPDAVPKIEPLAKRGNRPYTVFGVRYVPILDDKPYKQRGYGSWYGKKFHGQKTSSGELYDMYKMSAASPVLPIPSYARVTNLSNGKQVIVRVNDRGPFRSNRIIDLSYTAALKLGYIGHGSAQLEVERLLPSDIEQMQAAAGNGAPLAASARSEAVSAPAPMDTSAPTMAVASLGPLPAGFYLQFGAYTQMSNAEAVRTRLAQTMGAALPQLTVAPSSNLYRIYSGPFASREEASSAALQVQQSGTTKPFIVQR